MINICMHLKPARLLPSSRMLTANRSPRGQCVRHGGVDSEAASERVSKRWISNIEGCAAHACTSLALSNEQKDAACGCRRQSSDASIIEQETRNLSTRFNVVAGVSEKPEARGVKWSWPCAHQSSNCGPPATRHAGRGTVLSTYEPDVGPSAIDRERYTHDVFREVDGRHSQTRCDIWNRQQTLH